MAKEFTEQVLVLHVGRFREADLWLRLLSPTRGVYNAFAFGGAKSRRRFCGCLDALNRVLFRVKSSRGGQYLCLMEGSLLHSPTRLRRDNERLGLAVNCIKFVEAASAGMEDAEAISRLLAEALEVLDGEAEVSPLFPLLFRAKLAFDQGYAPDLEACAVCGAPAVDNGNTRGRPALLVERGRVACPCCAPGCGRPALSLSPRSLATLQSLRATGPRHWHDLHLDAPVRRECFQAVDHFVHYHMGLVWDRGAFRRT